MLTRERLLTFVVAGLTAVLAVQFGTQELYTAYTDTTTSLEGALAEHDKAKKTIEQGEVAKRAIEKMRNRSLPADVTLAQTLYLGWLSELGVKHGLDNLKVDPLPAPNSRKGGAYRVITVRVTADCTLEKLTKFLHAFYSVQQVHKIKSLEITPDLKTSTIAVNLQADAMLIEGSKRKELNVEQGDRMEGMNLADVQKTIADRNMFAIYVPPPPKREERVAQAAPPFDDAKHAKISGITADGDGWQAWLHVRTTGELMKLKEGEEFNVGKVKGTVKRIGAREVEIESDGKTLIVAVGQSLSEAAAQ